MTCTTEAVPVHGDPVRRVVDRREARRSCRRGSWSEKITISTRPGEEGRDREADSSRRTSRHCRTRNTACRPRSISNRDRDHDWQRDRPCLRPRRVCGIRSTIRSTTGERVDQRNDAHAVGDLPGADAAPVLAEADLEGMEAAALAETDTEDLLDQVERLVPRRTGCSQSTVAHVEAARRDQAPARICSRDSRRGWSAEAAPVGSFGREVQDEQR